MKFNTKKIYLVTQGEYSDYCVVGAFSTKEKAQKFIGENEGSGYSYDSKMIEEFEIDAGEAQRAAGLSYWQVSMDKAGSVTGLDNNQHEGPEADYFVGTHGEILVASMWARDEKHAIKIANERRLQLIALNNWSANSTELPERLEVELD